MEIKLDNLKKIYGKEIVVKDLSLCVPQGSIFGFIGPNGAGKTTTMKMMVGLVKPDKGKVLYDNISLQTLDNKLLSSIGSFISKPSYYPNLTAYENLAYIQKILNLPLEEVDRVLDLVKLTNVKNKKVRKFSLGMKQRLGLAFAFLNDPDILILDEPTNGLDPKGVFEIRQLLMHMSKNLKKTIFISSHNISEIEFISDYIGIINNGELLYTGTLASLYDNLESSYQIITDNESSTKDILDVNKHNYTNKKNVFNVQLSSSKVAALNNELVHNNINVLELSPNKSLENIFLALTSYSKELNKCVL